MLLGISLLVISILIDTAGVLLYVFKITISEEMNSLFFAISVIGFLLSVPGILLGGAKIEIRQKKTGVPQLIMSIFAISLFIAYIVFRYIIRLQAAGVALF